MTNDGPCGYKYRTISFLNSFEATLRLEELTEQTGRKHNTSPPQQSSLSLQLPMATRSPYPGVTGVRCGGQQGVCRPIIAIGWMATLHWICIWCPHTIPWAATLALLAGGASWQVHQEKKFKLKPLAAIHSLTIQFTPLCFIAAGVLQSPLCAKWLTLLINTPVAIRLDQFGSRRNSLRNKKWTHSYAKWQKFVRCPRAPTQNIAS